MRKLKKVLPTFLLVFGLLFAGASYYGYRLLLSNNDNAKQMTHQIQPEKEIQQQVNEKNKQANFDPDQIKPVEASEYASAQLKFTELVNQWGIGSVFIPSAGIQTKILSGMSNQNLMVATGTYYPDQKLGKGNFVLLAHNLVQGGGPLGNLPNTKIGHIIYATDFSRVYEYIVTKNSNVDHTEGELLDVPSDKEEALITLFRCEGNLNTPTRALVQGKYSKSYSAKDAPEDVKIGLGLGIIEESGIPVERVESSKSIERGSKETSSKMNDETVNSKENENKFSQEKPRYSLSQRIAIRCFSIINSHPIVLSIGFLVLLLLLLHFAK
ncbi:class A sortase [Enterococcus avium]|uniref:class A sortase n=1 Tax=Enterococcus avium TaxID=33945 RepID=UPI0037A5E7FB